MPFLSHTLNSLLRSTIIVKMTLSMVFAPLKNQLQWTLHNMPQFSNITTEGTPQQLMHKPQSIGPRNLCNDNYHKPTSHPDTWQMNILSLRLLTPNLGLHICFLSHQCCIILDNLRIILLCNIHMVTFITMHCYHMGGYLQTHWHNTFLYKH